MQRGRDAIFAWGGSQARPVIDKGDGSYLTSGYAKDALWTARRIAEANELGLNTADFWEAKPDEIQGKINQAKLAIARGEAPEAVVRPLRTHLVTAEMAEMASHIRNAA